MSKPRIRRCPRGSVGNSARSQKKMSARESSAVERAVARYYAGGTTIAAAAEAEGVSRSALIRALRRRGEPPAAPGAPPKPPPAMPEPYHFHDLTPLRPARARKPGPRRRK